MAYPRHPRAPEIVAAIQAGKSNAEIIKALGVSSSRVSKYRQRLGLPPPHTVPHIRRMCCKTGVQIGSLGSELTRAEDAFVDWLLDQNNGQETLSQTTLRIMRGRYEEENDHFNEIPPASTS